MTSNEDHSSNENSGTKNGTSHSALIFKVTENMLKANVNGFVLNGSDFEFTFSNGRKLCILFSGKDGSISNNVRRISKKLLSELKGKVDLMLLRLVLDDMEDELVNRRDEIFQFINNCSKNSNHAGVTIDNAEDATAKSKFLEEVANIKKQFNESIDPYKQWQLMVAENYSRLRVVTIKHYPEAWPLLEFCLAVKSILNTEGFTLPFMGVLLAAPASMKTMIIQLFRKYHNSFYTDSFTPNSIVSHNSALTEEQLQQIDMLPKMKDKVFLTPELAPIFTTKEDELQKILGMVTRILDGHGFANDSGAHGHRRYGDTMFVWIGAAVEIPFRVWRVLGNLGHKIYFFRPDISEKTVKQLKEIAKTNSFEVRFKEIEYALLEYLKVFDAAPETDQVTRDKSGLIVKVKWNESAEQEEGQEQDNAIECIAKVSKLLACLRGTVYVSEAKSTRRRFNESSTNNGQYQQQILQQSNVQEQLQQQYTDIFYQIDGQDYDTGLPIIEDPSRAVILLRNLAVGHAVSQGRDSIRLEDVPVAIKVALSTAMYNRIKVFDLLLKNYGELTTSDITKGLRISEPTARRTMREFHALRLADISAIAEYANAELKITLRPEYSWFKTEEFNELREGFILGKGADADATNVQSKSCDDCDSTTALSNKHQDTAKSDTCDSNQHCHTSKVNPPPDTDEKNNSIACDNQQQEWRYNSEPEDAKTERNSSTDTSAICTNKEYNHQQQQREPYDNNEIDITEKNIACLWESDRFQHVTQSQSHTPTESASKSILEDAKDIVLEQILSKIKDANGSQVAVNAIIEAVHNQNEQAKNYLGNNLTSRDNRKVRSLCLRIIRHHNIEVIKHKPQLVVKWVDEEDRQEAVAQNRSIKQGSKEE